MVLGDPTSFSLRPTPDCSTNQRCSYSRALLPLRPTVGGDTRYERAPPRLPDSIVALSSPPLSTSIRAFGSTPVAPTPEPSLLAQLSSPPLPHSTAVPGAPLATLSVRRLIGAAPRGHLSRSPDLDLRRSTTTSICAFRSCTTSIQAPDPARTSTSTSTHISPRTSSFLARLDSHLFLPSPSHQSCPRQTHARRNRPRIGPRVVS
ncbi:hypothetical protein B0H14DRAFT_1464616 [Mycena olivaceomarginata]|nr:hypothetical protein B0H14DRAFT_1464616 [Mycena olivaceomarginata]